MAAPGTFRFTRAQRLTGRGVFAAVLAERARRPAGPLVFHARPAAAPNGPLQHHRLGLSVGRKVGTAVARNRIKRLLREAFRLTQHDLPGAYDVVVIVRPHAPATLADYQRWLTESVAHLHGVWTRRARKGGDG